MVPGTMRGAEQALHRAVPCIENCPLCLERTSLRRGRQQEKDYKTNKTFTETEKEKKLIKKILKHPYLGKLTRNKNKFTETREQKKEIEKTVQENSELQEKETKKSKT